MIAEVATRADCGVFTVIILLALMVTMLVLTSVIDTAKREILEAIEEKKK